MKEVISIEESMNEDIKKLEDTMASEGVAPMIKRFKEIEDEDALGSIVSKGMPDEIAPAEPADIMAELSAEVDIEGVGVVKFPIDPVPRKVYTPVVVKAAKTRVFSSGLKVVKTHTEKVLITLSPLIISVCNSLQRKVGHNEFSIVCKGKWGDDGSYIVSEDYKVPKQKVDGAAVDYDLDHLEQLKMEGYNTVIHSHPFKSANFSSSDDETINSHFECSVLYSVGEFTTATIAVVPVPGMKLIITGNPTIEGDDNVVPESESSNIEKKFKDTYSKYYNYGYWYGYDNPDFSVSKYSRNSQLIGSHPEDCEKEYDHHITNNERELDRFRNSKLGAGNYVYDPATDVLLKNGKPVNGFGQSRVKVHTAATEFGCGCSESNTQRIFRTNMATSVHADQKPGVFSTDTHKKDTSTKKSSKKNR